MKDIKYFTGLSFGTQTLFRQTWLESGWDPFYRLRPDLTCSDPVEQQLHFPSEIEGTEFLHQVLGYFQALVLRRLLIAKVDCITLVFRLPP